MLAHLASMSVSASVWSKFRLSDDLPGWAQLMVLSLVVATLVLLIIETRRERSKRVWVLLSGFLAAVLLACAVLRPVLLTLKGRTVPGYVMVFVDGSHRLDLPATDRYGLIEKTRRQVALEAVDQVKAHHDDARVVVRHFTSELHDAEGVGEAATSDLLTALPQALAESGELPQAIVLVSDGRLTRPGPKSDESFGESLRAAARGVPIHTVAVSEASPRDRSIRALGLTGSAVAHQPFRLEIEVGCFPVETCAEVEVEIYELMERQPERLLAQGEAQGQDGRAVLSLEVTLEQAGNRALLIQLKNDVPDDVAQNDHRIVPVYVKRDRLRMLHVAGRPTYDVRALRTFLKSDESIDLISFFILRTESDQVQADQDELALIPFPVDELFSEHLASFDAIILQDIDARRYRLDRYFRAMKDYVLHGGGMILVGGPTGFSSGGYAGSSLEEVLPVYLSREGELTLRKSFVPVLTEAGRAAPILKAVRNSLGEGLPEMSGANVLGAAREGTLVLWEHPSEVVSGASPPEKMPVLAVREVGDGRSVAISVDGTHQLRFGEVGARTGGRAHADLWEGLLGWLMRDPRYESAQLQLDGPCVANHDQTFVVDPIAGLGDSLRLTLERLGAGAADTFPLQEIEAGPGNIRRFVARKIPEGGYAARVHAGAAPPTRAVIACEEGGEAWADSRPDPERLQAIAEATSGNFVDVDRVREIPRIESSFISAQRESKPVFASWIWATLAVALMSAHWLIRRAVGHA